MTEKTEITIIIDPEKLSGYTDVHLASLWYVAQANPAPIENREAGEIAEQVGREIIKRFVRQAGAPLWDHQGRHYAQCLLSKCLSN